jgi:hypothetical protein
MLKVHVELLPGGDPTRRRPLATMSLANISELRDISDYNVTVIEAENSLTGAPARLCSCVVRNHTRAQSVWALVAAAIAEMANAECADL